jgi:hypothetical protein
VFVIYLRYPLNNNAESPIGRETSRDQQWDIRGESSLTNDLEEWKYIMKINNFLNSFPSHIDVFEQKLQYHISHAEQRATIDICRFRLKLDMYRGFLLPTIAVFGKNPPQRECQRNSHMPRARCYETAKVLAGTQFQTMPLLSDVRHP